MTTKHPNLSPTDPPTPLPYRQGRLFYADAPPAATPCRPGIGPGDQGAACVPPAAKARPSPLFFVSKNRGPLPAKKREALGTFPELRFFAICMPRREHGGIPPALPFRLDHQSPLAMNSFAILVDDVFQINRHIYPSCHAVFQSPNRWQPYSICKHPKNDSTFCDTVSKKKNGPRRSRGHFVVRRLGRHGPRQSTTDSCRRSHPV